MKQSSGIWLPDGDTHFPELLAVASKLWKRPTYQVDRFLACLPYIKRFRHAVDAGAHCGLWSIVMARSFAKLTAFEPMARHAECWRRNVTDANATLHEMALSDGSTDRLLMTMVKDNSGLSHVSASGTEEVRSGSLDSVELDALDFIKLDCEGYEYLALLGGETTILTDRPCILVEQAENMVDRYGSSAIDLLTSWGAELRWSQGRDHCLSWPC